MRRATRLNKIKNYNYYSLLRRVLTTFCSKTNWENRKNHENVKKWKSENLKILKKWKSWKVKIVKSQNRENHENRKSSKSKILKIKNRENHENQKSWNSSKSKILKIMKKKSKSKVVSTSSYIIIDIHWNTLLPLFGIFHVSFTILRSN